MSDHGLDPDWEDAQARADAAVQRAAEEYAAAWPNHCRSCGGWGIHSWTEMHGFTYGAGEQFTEPCDGCWGRGVCPRCGHPDLPDEAAVCMACGWDETTEGIPNR